MQHELPPWHPSATSSSSAGSAVGESPAGDTTNNTHDINSTSVQKLVSENAVIVFGRRGCCMCHVVKRLLLGLGVNPNIFYIDDQDEAAVIDELSRIIGAGKDGRPEFPAIFVGGKLFGGLERVMATHISGELVPILKKAGALWL